jgi:hypothetical protein
MNRLRKGPRPLHDHGHGVQQDNRGQDQRREETEGEQAQRDTAEAQPQSPGEPQAGGG